MRTNLLIINMNLQRKTADPCNAIKGTHDKVKLCGHTLKL